MPPTGRSNASRHTAEPPQPCPCPLHSKEPVPADGASCDLRIGKARLILYLPARLHRVLLNSAAGLAGILSWITTHHPR
jgi:hypothetical protein